MPICPFRSCTSLSTLSHGRQPNQSREQPATESCSGPCCKRTAEAGGVQHAPFFVHTGDALKIHGGRWAMPVALERHGRRDGACPKQADPCRCLTWPACSLARSREHHGEHVVLASVPRGITAKTGPHRKGRRAQRHRRPNCSLSWFVLTCPFGRGLEVFGQSLVGKGIDNCGGRGGRGLIGFPFWCSKPICRPLKGNLKQETKKRGTRLPCAC